MNLKETFLKYATFLMIAWMIFAVIAGTALVIKEKWAELVELGLLFAVLIWFYLMGWSDRGSNDRNQAK